MSGFEPPQGPPEPRPERALQSPRRFAGGAVVLGVVAGFLGTPVMLLVAGLIQGFLGDAGDAGQLVAALLGAALILGPPVRALDLAVKKGSAQRRGFALGYVIGVAVLVIVGAGLCVAVLAQLGSG